ncbi:MAG: protein phosphatase 2C domain-containing protein [Pirellulaceae bacterium]
MPAHDARIYLDQDMQQPELLELAGGSAAVYSARSPYKQTPNEDAAAVLPVDDARTVLVVADGLGGMTAGERASSLAVTELQRSIAAMEGGDQMLRTAILNGIESANRTIGEMGLGAATTAAVVEIDHGVVRPYHVGDSMILVVGQRGKVKLQTVSHSPVSYAFEAGLLDEQEAMHHEDRHLVSNVIGSPDMRIEIGAPLELAPRDTLVLASDGLLDNLYNDEIIQWVRKGRIERLVAQVAGECRRRMTEPQEGVPCKPDDLTLVVYRRGG